MKKKGELSNGCEYIAVINFAKKWRRGQEEGVRRGVDSFLQPLVP